MLWLMLLQALTCTSAEQPAAPHHLRVEDLDEAVAVLSEPLPRFSFMHPPVPNGQRGLVQAAYRIKVSKLGAKTPLWDSGSVASAATSVIYAGPALSAFTRYTWTAEWASSAGDTSATALSHFETGPLVPSDWKNAAWLSAGAEDKAQFRFTFNLPKAVVWARAYIAAPGCHTLEVNGHLPAMDLRGICPWVVENKEENTRYMTHNLTNLLVKGKNAVGLLAGHVMLTDEPIPQILGLVMVQLEGDDKPLFFSTASAGWLQTTSYVVDDSAWATTINWTKVEAGWSMPTFLPGSHWVPTKPALANTTVLPARALQMPLSTVIKEVKPSAVRVLPSGEYLYTFPVNFVGTIKVAPLPGAASGSSLNIVLGEWLEATKPIPTPPAPAPGTSFSRCGTALDKHAALKLGGCRAGHVIDSVAFASYGMPIGDCTSGFQISSCNANTSVAVVEKLCLGKANCRVPVNATMLGFHHQDPCPESKKWLSAIVHCTGDPPTPPTPAPAPTSPPSPPTSLSYPAISGYKQQNENHILRNGNSAPIETIFCWHGLQYALVTPIGDTTFSGRLDAIVGLVIRTNISTTGTLSFGGDGVAGSASTQAAAVLTGVDSMTRASQLSNVAAYMMTDCPTREKHGWMGDALDGSEQALYNFGIAAVHSAFMQTIEDNQGPGGDVPYVVPAGIPKNGSCNDIAWTSAYPQIIAMHQIYRGDDRLARRHWPSLVRYQENLILNAQHGLATCDKFEDWLCGINASKDCCSNTGPAGSSCPVKDEMAGFNYVLGLRAMAQMATSLGHEGKASRYEGLAKAATAEFHASFYNPVLGKYGGDDGAAQSLAAPALAIGSPPANLTRTIVATVQRDLDQREPAYTAAVGAVTSKIILNVLSDNGLHESALRVATQTAAPSWGFWWTQGATTCWEAWPGGASPVGRPGDGTKNHVSACTMQARLTTGHFFTDSIRSPLVPARMYRSFYAAASRSGCGNIW
jgi:hypothetical protein